MSAQSFILFIYLGNIKWCEFDSDALAAKYRLDLLRNRIEKKIKTNNANYRAHPADFVHLLLCYYTHHIADREYVDYTRLRR